MLESGKLWTLWEMLQSYFPIYKIALELQTQRSNAELLKRTEVSDYQVKNLRDLLGSIHEKCLEFGLPHTSDMAKRILDRPARQPFADKYYFSDMFSDLDHLDGSLGNELSKEAVFRIPPERKDYFEQPDLFGPEVATAFPSCGRDIEKAGSCYALGQEDASVHHLMLVLERGLRAQAVSLRVQIHNANWQQMIDQINAAIKLLPSGPQRDFNRKASAEFGFLKEAYRNHSEHAHDDPYDMELALSILNHVRAFMRELAKGGLTE